jgi:hypothetical protein
MGKQRKEHPQDSIFADNPFIDGLFEWMDSEAENLSISPDFLGRGDSCRV